MTDIVTTLEALGFTKHCTGGNCFAMMRQHNGARIYVTDSDGNLPEASDWLVTVETDKGEELATFSSGSQGVWITSAIGAALTYIK